MDTNFDKKNRRTEQMRFILDEVAGLLGMNYEVEDDSDIIPLVKEIIEKNKELMKSNQGLLTQFGKLHSEFEALKLGKE